MIQALNKSVHVFTDTFGMLSEYRKKENPDLVTGKKQWSRAMLDLIGADLEVIGDGSLNNNPRFFVGNHISYVDIIVVLNVIPFASFVSKDELQRWPVLGPAAEFAGTIFLKRGNLRSRADVREQIATAVLEQKKSVAIFPSGTTKIGPSVNWSRSVFKIAGKHGVQVQPFRIQYEPLRPVAYIDNDFFPVHLVGLMKLGKIKVKLEFHPVITVEDIEKDCQRIKTWCETKF